MSKLKDIRTDKGISQSKLGALSGVNYRTIQEYEQGRRDINMATAVTVKAIADALGVRMEDVMEPEEHRNYFKNVVCEDGAVFDWSEVELIIPEGFKKQLNSMEKSMLMDDQLRTYKLRMDDLAFNTGGTVCRRIIKLEKAKQPLEKKPDISKRLKEYLELFKNM